MQINLSAKIHSPHIKNATFLKTKWHIIKSLWDILQHWGFVYLILFIISFEREGVLGIKVSRIKLYKR